MCGLSGGWSRKRIRDLQGALPQMTGAIAHRGPDDAGHWSDSEAGIALGHRRLAIVDLTAAGHQPMVSSSGRWVIVFNGEIYNHLELREQMESGGCAPPWRGHSDTETLLGAIEAWGVQTTLERCAGMFAFALWDRTDRAIWLVRDRFGEKPLYYGWNRGVFLFGSELKSLRAFPGFDAAVDRHALALYLRHSAVPAPFSIYQGIHKLRPGHWLRVSANELERGVLPQSTSYWTALEQIWAARANPFVGSEGEAIDELERLLCDAVRRQMVADVPLGAFLSGGIDSSLVVALMQVQSARPVRTFSIGFNERGYNEAEHAAAVAHHLGTEHTEMYVTSKDALDVIPQLPAMNDEPFADSSQVPTSLVAKLARSSVSVALSGDGGDELFGGYSRYFFAARVWRYLHRLPMSARALASASLSAIPIPVLDAGCAGLKALLGKRASISGDRIHKAALTFTAKNGADFYERLISHWGSEVLADSVQPPSYSLKAVGDLSLIEQMMLSDSCHYMPDDILAKVDRAAMAYSLETRVPLLDHRIFEFAWRLPIALKVRSGVGKHILRQVLYRHVPRSLIDRPKMGFGVPLDRWLRGPLKDWAASLLDPARIKREGFFDPEVIARKWTEHQSGTRNWQYHLWDILMFQAWLSSYGSDENRCVRQ